MMRILVVDDEDLLRYSLAKALKECGAEVTTVTNGKDAVAASRRNPYDMCFLDVQLPDSNGLELMKMIRSRSPGTMIVIMTANELTEEEIGSIGYQGCLYLPKPFELHDAQAIVTRHQSGV